MYLRKDLPPERVTRTITFLIRISLIVVSVLAVFVQNWPTLFAGLGTLVLTYVPQLLASQINVRIPLQFEFAITIFLYASIFLGEVGGYYEKFWWWDVVLHAGSAFAFGFAGFLILYLMHARGKLQASPFLIAVFSFTFGVAIGTMWEIFEFFVDSTFGTNMLKSGLRDTFGDLIVNTIGVGLASTIGYVYLKYEVRDPFDAFIGWFIKDNPRFKPYKISRKRKHR